MKKTIMLLLLVCGCSWHIIAQDIIIKRTGEQIKALISEVNPDDIKYKDLGGQYGKVLLILKKDIHKIKYSDGSEDLFNPLNPGVKLKTDNVVAEQKTSSAKKPESEKTPKKEEKNTAFQQAPLPQPAPSLSSASDEKGVFITSGVNYVKMLADNSPNQVGLQITVGYHFSDKVGAAAMFEPSYVLGVSGGTVINTMVYPAVLYKAAKGIYIYGGFGLYGVYASGSGVSNFQSTTGYQGGVIVNLGPVGLKAGYLNATDAGSKGSITVGICKSLKW